MFYFMNSMFYLLSLVVLVFFFSFFSFSFFLDVSELLISSVMDDKTVVFVFTVMVITMWIMLYNNYYMGSDFNNFQFTSLMIMFMLSMLLLIFFPYFPMVILGWDYLGVVSYLLVIYYNSKLASSSGMITILSNRIGDMLMILSIVMVFSLLEEKYLSIIVSMMLFICVLTKSAQVPFSVWLPAAMTAPTPVSSLVHSSTLVTAGVYLFLRFNKYFLVSSWYYLVVVSSILLTSFLASYMGMYESDLKKVVAFSTLSQLSFMLISAINNNVVLALFHLLMHAYFKSSLFMFSGVFIHSGGGNQDLRNFSSSTMFKNTIFMFNVSSLVMAGMPFLSAFYSKDLMIEMGLSSSSVYMLMILFSFAVVMTSLYSMRIVFLVNYFYMKMMFMNYALVSKKVNLLYLFLFSSFMFSFMINSEVVMSFNSEFMWIYKMYPPFWVMMGVFMFICLYLFKIMNWDYKMMGLLKMSSMQLSKSSFFFAKDFFNVVDWGWNEITGSKGVEFLFKKFFMSFNMSMKMSFFIFMFMVFSLILFM